MTITKIKHCGGLEISDIIDGHRVSKVYYGHTRREARKLFRDQFHPKKKPAPRKMLKFTVLLRYPDYAPGGNWPDDQVSHRVEAVNAKAALTAAQKAEARAIKQDGDWLNDPDDLAMVAIYEGHSRLVTAAAVGV